MQSATRYMEWRVVNGAGDSARCAPALKARRDDSTGARHAIRHGVVRDRAGAAYSPLCGGNVASVNSRARADRAVLRCIC